MTDQTTAVFVSRHWQTFVGIVSFIFASGIAYSEFKELHKDLAALQKDNEILRLQLFDEIEERVDALEEQRAFQEGVNSQHKIQ